MKNSNTNINRPEISSEEINAAKNFDAQLQKFNANSKPFFKQKWVLANSFVLITAGIIAMVYLTNNKAETETLQSEIVVEESIQTSELITENIIAKKPFVSPPIEGLNVPFTSYIVLGNKGKTIKHKSGSFLKIPKNAFVNKTGNIIKGKIEIKYREFKDIAEIFASGIPMTYKENGEEFHFESAGMIEILAYQNGKPVFMNPKKKIDIEMTSDYSGTHYNLYSLDTSQGEWIYKGKDKVIIKDEAINQNIVVESHQFEDDIDRQLIASTPKNNTDLKTIKDEVVVIQKDIKNIKKTEPTRPTKATGSRFRFNLDVDKKEFPEMQAYEGLEFEIGKENKNFDPKLTNKEWHDISLSKNKQNKYVLTLKRYLNKKEIKGNDSSESNMDVRDFIVYPVYEGDNYAAAMIDFNNKFDSYSEKLADRKEDERIKKEEYEKKLAEIKAENERLRKEWEAEASNRQKSQRTSSQIYRAFSAYRFGTLNCDSPIRRPSGQTVKPAFVNNLKKRLNINQLFLVEKSRNAVFSYFSNEGYFKFDPKADNFIVGVTNDNKLISFTQEQFKAIPKTARKYDFEMKTEPTTPTNIKQLKQCISFL